MMLLLAHAYAAEPVPCDKPADNAAELPSSLLIVPAPAAPPVQPESVLVVPSQAAPAVAPVVPVVTPTVKVDDETCKVKPKK